MLESDVKKAIVDFKESVKKPAAALFRHRTTEEIDRWYDRRLAEYEAVEIREVLLMDWAHRSTDGASEDVWSMNEAGNGDLKSLDASDGEDEAKKTQRIEACLR
ncbi:hypothetical protein M427DRAFT_46097 [Gonapodya prolifera JEL478]|uniref:Uncharacterized protein n=1 Tax=Gonapodya prolifera (strain JEL478) TaxID=1344416 RepID=A0A139A7Q8_GONPJ|nr:hypothetical protein M427DRAFT_46097 [Gonapodya prolifera JEL478]|eukprot:KXS12836.1 hypothetical protein M427DRAFT_46097 [Gonapodya prolifera JEL478]